MGLFDSITSAIGGFIGGAARVGSTLGGSIFNVGGAALQTEAGRALLGQVVETGLTKLGGSGVIVGLGGQPPIQGPALPPGFGNAPSFAPPVNNPASGSSSQTTLELPGFLGGGSVSFGFDEGRPAPSPGITGGGMAGSAVVPFGQASAASVRAQQFVTTHPVTGAPVWFRPAGRPILFSGDLAACRRVERAAKMARKALRKR